MLDYTSYAFPPGFVPAGFNSTNAHFIRPSGVADVNFGLSGGGGRLFGFLYDLVKYLAVNPVDIN